MEASDRQIEIIENVIPFLMKRGFPGREVKFLNRDKEVMLWLYNNGGWFEPSEEFYFGFPRGDFTRPKYAQIREWFKLHRLPWRDRQRYNKRYMVFETGRGPDQLSSLVTSAVQDVFEQPIHSIETNQLNLAIFANSRFPRTEYWIRIAFWWMAVGIFIYELLHILKIDWPSVDNLDRIERLFVVAIIFAPAIKFLASHSPPIAQFRRGYFHEFDFRWLHYPLIFMILPLLALITL